MAKKASAETIAIGGEAPTNGGKQTVEAAIPYIIEVELQGTSDIVFHRWNCESVGIKADAPKGSKAKKTDDVESYVYRNEENELCLPGEYVRQSIIHCAKFKQDPRSPRKSAMDLFKAAVVALTPLASFGKLKWDYEDRRRAVVQRAAITRVRPALKAGWKATMQFQCNLPEYVSPDLLHEVLEKAGRLIGVADMRPTFGRFSVTRFEVLDL